MSTFYLSSVAYAAIAAFQISHAYVIGDIVRPISAAEGRKQAYRCTTGGTSGGSESAWTGVSGGTTTQGTAVFTAISGDTYGWTAALGDSKTVANIYMSTGDTCYISSDHSETIGTYGLGNALGGSWSTATTHFVCVNRAGSVPPVAADVTTGAAITCSSTLNLDALGPTRWEGITFTVSGAASLGFNGSAFGRHYLKNCTLALSNANASLRIQSNNIGSVIFDNVTLSFANASQGVTAPTYPLDLTWINSPTPLAGTSPTTLFLVPSAAGAIITLRGVDLSSYTGNICNYGATSGWSKLLLESCKISASATLISGTSGPQPQVLELVNCWDGTNVLNSRVTAAGAVTTERTIVLSSGATDDVGALSFKMVTNASKLDRYVQALDCFYFDIENTATGSSKTATIELNASAALNDNDVWVRLEYMGTSGNPIASFLDTLPTTVLTAAAALSTSTATWSSSPATPVPQKLTVAFTPQRAGRVRAQVFLGKASTTIYVNPQITIS